MKLAGIVLITFCAKAYAKISNDKYSCDALLSYSLLRTTKQGCTYNPDIGEDAPTVAAYHGYYPNIYEVTTEDGYILSVIRITHNKVPKRRVVFLGHPYTTDSVVWVNKGNNSLAFMLLEEGYDVWLGNSRGTRLSARHLNLTVEDEKFWEYSFHEIGTYDYPAMLDLVKHVTKAEKISFIGHSAAATAALIYSSLLKEKAKETVDLFILMSPVSYCKDMGVNIEEVSPSMSALLMFKAMFGELNYLKAVVFCRELVVQHAMFLFYRLHEQYGNTPDQIYPPWAPLALKAVPQGINLKQLYHYFQMAKAKRFQQFDYSPRRNRRIYSSEEPPEYPVGDIEVPVLIIYSRSDRYFSTKDAEFLYGQFSGAAKTYKPYHIAGFNHIDFAYGKYVTTLYKYILSVLKKREQNVSNA